MKSGQQLASSQPGPRLRRLGGRSGWQEVGVDARKQDVDRGLEPSEPRSKGQQADYQAVVKFAFGRGYRVIEV